MNPDERLAQIVRELRSIGVEALVMGGHAVRHYGVDRNTVDFDFYTAVDSTADLRRRVLASTAFRNARDGPSWRPEEFARFAIGQLADGREEWLEFWLHNHLLPVFGELQSRQEKAVYGGTELSFISLPDLLRSKETEREGDWKDIALLEEIQDARGLAAVRAGQDVGNFLLRLRSRRGFDDAFAARLFDAREAVEFALGRCEYPVTFAYLLPLKPHADVPASLRTPIEAAYLATLRSAPFASQKHHNAVEIVRRWYRRRAMEIDREEKRSRFHQ